MAKIHGLFCFLIGMMLFSCNPSKPIELTPTTQPIELTPTTQPIELTPTIQPISTTFLGEVTGSPSMGVEPVVSEITNKLFDMGTLGYGYANDTAWSADGQMLAVGTSAGIAIYDTSNLQSNPSWHNSSVGVVTSLFFSPDGNLLVIAGWEGLTLWNLVTGEEEILRTEGYPAGAAFSPDGKQLVANSGVNDALLWEIWDVTNGKLITQWQGGNIGGLGVVAFSPDGKVLASAYSNRTEGHSDGTVYLWDVSTGKLLLRLGVGISSLAGVAFSPDGKTLASGQGDNSVSLWDVASGELLYKMQGHTGPVVSVAFSPNGSYLASLDSGEDRQVHVWDIASRKSLVAINGCPRTDYANEGTVKFSPDGSMISSACEDGGVIIWNLATGQVKQISLSYSYGVSDIDFSPDGKSLAVGYARNWDMSQPIDIFVWDVEAAFYWGQAPGTYYKRLSGHLGIVNAVAFDPDGVHLASGGVDGTVRLWNTTTGDSKLILKGYPMSEGSLYMLGTTLENFPVSSLAFSPNGAILAVGGGGFWSPGWLEFYDVITSQQISMLFPKCDFPCGGLSDVHEIAFNPDGTMLASAHGDGIVRIWDVANGKEIRELADIQGSIAFSPDGKMLITEGSLAEGNSATAQDLSGGIQFWDVQTGKMVKMLDVGVESIRSMAISPDGRILAVVHDRSVDLWEMASGEIFARIGGDSPVISFGPDGSGLAVGDSSGVIHLWVMLED